MRKLIAIAIASLIFSFSVSAQQTTVVAAQQQQQPSATPNTMKIDFNLKPNTTTKYTNSKPKPRPKTSGRRSYTVNNGWTGSAVIELPQAPVQQQQQQSVVVNGQVQAISDDLEDFKKTVTGDIKTLNGKVTILANQTGQNTSDIAGIITALGQQKEINEQVSTRLDNTVTREEFEAGIKKAGNKVSWKTVGLSALAGFGGGVVGGVVGSKISNKNNNNTNNCWRNGRNVCQSGGGGGIICPQRNPMMYMPTPAGCYNQPVGGDCRVRGNCNYNGGGPVRVPNCPIGAVCGNYQADTTYNQSSGYNQNTVYTQNSGYNQPTYNQPRNNNPSGGNALGSMLWAPTRIN